MTEIQSKLLVTATTFVELITELSILFIAISFFVAILNQKIPKEKIQKILSANKGGYFFAAGLGALTPFCSCSTIPMLIGLLKARASFGPLMTFLFTSPLLNPIIIVLFIPVLGINVTIVYALLALTLSIIAGMLLQFFSFNRFIHANVVAPSEYDNDKECSTNNEVGYESKTTNNLYKNAWKESITLFKSIFPYIFVAMIIGAVVTGFVPNSFFADIAGADNMMAVPAAAIIGIPLYVRVTSLIPLVGAFIAKGVSVGAIVALIIGAGGASIPELILLKRLFMWPLICAFLSVIFFIAIIGGYTLNIFMI